MPAEVKAFLHQYIASVGHLDLVLFLYKNSNQKWTELELTKEMRSNTSLVAAQLTDLADIVVKSPANPPQFQFDSQNLSALNCVRKLNELYQSHPHSLIDEIYLRPLDRIKTFARAFKFKIDE